MQKQTSSESKSEPEPRTCPRCSRACARAHYEDVELDHCPRCQGTFLDAGEATELFGPYADPETWKKARDTENRGPSSSRCPKDDTPFDVYRVTFREQHPLEGAQHESVTIELCPKCAGLWLDLEEGKQLREIVMAAGQRSETKLSDFASNPGVGSYLFQLLSGFPVEAWNPLHRFPAVCVALLGLFGLTFLAMLEAQSLEWVFRTFGMIPAEIRGGDRLWTLLTSAFVHGGLMHLLMNGYFLYVFGTNVEDAVGRSRFVALFLAAALAGAMLQTVLQADPTIPVVGASGAIAGMMGAYLFLFPRVRIFQVVLFIRFRIGIAWYLALWVGLNLVMALTGPGQVAVWTHLGGFAAGAVLGYAWRIRPLAEVLRPAVKR